MPILVVLPSDLSKLERQIKALKAVIPKDNPKDKAIHEMALMKLESHKSLLIRADKYVCEEIK